MKQILLIFFCFFLKIVNAQAPSVQDCMGAIPICDGTITMASNFLGSGNIPNEINGNISCLGVGERNSVWFKINIAQSGLLGFNIIQHYEPVDIDWALYNLTNHNCSDIFNNPSLEVSCNYSGSVFPTSTTGANNGPNPQDAPFIPVLQGETYYLVIIKLHDFFLDLFTLDFTLGTCEIGACSKLSGTVFMDENENCIKDENEATVPNIPLRLVGEQTSFLTTTDEQGNYTFNFFNGGDMILEVVPFSPLVSDHCDDTPLLLNFPPEFGFYDGPNVPFLFTEDCSQLVVQNTIPFLRRCFNMNRSVKVCNMGNLQVDEVVIRMEYDGQVIPLQASAPMNFIEENIYDITLYNLAAFSCQTVIILDSTDCAINVLEMGTACVQASVISPYIICSTLPEELSVLNVNLECLPEASLKIENNSSFPVIGEYRAIVVNNQYQLLSTNLILSAYGTFEHTFDENEIDASSNLDLILIRNSPQNWIDPSASISAINCEFNNQNPVGSTVIQHNSALSCEPIVGSYDPNDKTGFPAGIGPENRILPQQNLKYRIRFQNTGNDTAFTVLIRDTLSAYLDLATVVPGNSSHPYHFEKNGNILIFTFNNILLPDSNTNEPGSIGFIEYYIRQRVNNPEEYIINNNAAIYFDFNDPIITNTHSYLIKPWETLVNETPNPIASFETFPNPTRDISTIHLDDKYVYVNLKVFDLSGRIVFQQNSIKSGYTFNLETLQEGIYFIQLDNKKGWVKRKSIVKLK